MILTHSPSGAIVEGLKRRGVEEADFLGDTIALNGLRNVQAVRMACGAEPGTATYSVSTVVTQRHHVEGLPTGRWVLIDFVDFVVHLFHPETRSFYLLERLWSDAPELLVGSS